MLLVEKKCFDRELVKGNFAYFLSHNLHGCIGVAILMVLCIKVGTAIRLVPKFNSPFVHFLYFIGVLNVLWNVICSNAIA